MRRTSSTLRLTDLLPELSVSEADRDMLRDLAGTLVTHNLEQSNTLLVTKKGYPDSNTGQWKEMRRKDGLRIYRERPKATRGGAPFTPSLLLLGTVDGTVEDVMYGVVATTDAALKIKSTCVSDGMLDTKMLRELAEPSREDPFRHVGIKWKLYDGRDYVSLDAMGVVRSSNGERVGYNLSHSVAFPDLPEFTKHGVLRGNMSVCSLYRQKTLTSVECYVRGFFDFPSKNEMLNNVALQALATQWLSFGRTVECGCMKKLAWKLRRNSLDGRSSDGSSASTCSSYDSSSSPRPSPPPSIRPGACARCSHSFGFLGTSRATCRSCMQSVCTRCTVKKLVCAIAPDSRTVLEKKRSFCRECIKDILMSDTLAIAREELAFYQGEESVDGFQCTPERWKDLKDRRDAESVPIPQRTESCYV
ncbi:hypothetical protein PHYPSEUDO_013538 [Phytophthora pseudosyringae]|uniref:FYVE-type domain-containing protein n=1 Tax=Phytophthora pseudosyringae TaxID=221518 RepID=A0A8T1W2P1_9STRA|nr:hypothetical protein PHYPSEUDO_013538 [Phytophthora pseudosyringae]